ncbi:MAG: hypothetical protein AABM29_07130 [Actinomycetota bacterium]
MATLTLFAHAGHYLWVMYIPPVLIVVGSIVKTTLSERRAEREEQAGAREESEN